MRWQNLIRTCLAIAAAALLALPAASAVASSNTGPSKATPVTVGKPFTGIWDGTPYGHTYLPSHWWKLPVVLRPGDTIQIAVDNRLSKWSTSFCLVPPVDDFGASDAFGRCPESNPFVGYGSQDRLQMTYGGATGQAFLVAFYDLECCFGPGDTVESGKGQYTVTIEGVTQLVNIGMAVPPALPATFTLGASVVYGDNTPVADGIPAALQWRPVAPRGSDPLPFANLATGTSAAGGITFAGTFPPEAQGQKVQLRACVTQPGGPEVRCGTGARTLVAESACSRALDKQLVLTRVVKRLAKNVRRLRAGPAKLRLKRKLKAKRRKLAQANRSVKTHCG